MNKDEKITVHLARQQIQGLPIPYALFKLFLCLILWSSCGLFSTEQNNNATGATYVRGDRWRASADRHSWSRRRTRRRSGADCREECTVVQARESAQRGATKSLTTLYRWWIAQLGPFRHTAKYWEASRSRLNGDDNTASRLPIGNHLRRGVNVFL